ncbi:MAG: antibiotic biosynthesis monooxygenase [Verrucomicrobiae bacterium]|nr:antibiotic biosynthesis monooxygenase [Verrucomicrobiae bacterium]
MHVLMVHARVKPECAEAFRAATLENARHSRKEEGVVRFDLFRMAEDPSRFMILEIYRQTGDHAKHRETAHYRKWREVVEAMMAEPRRGEKWTDCA